ncbi:MAG TPA: hypothetical protein VIU38_01200 [Anaerolineales bacterium]
MDAVASVTELRLVYGRQAAWIDCEAAVVPAPGRYVLAHDHESDAPLATELFALEYGPRGFLAGPPVPREWQPGSILDVRGPLGLGFELPAEARRVALVAFDGDPSRLIPLAATAIRQAASVALVCDTPPLELPLQLEIHPVRGLAEVCEWSDYAAIDVDRGSVSELLGVLTRRRGVVGTGHAQALVRAPMPCGGIGQCGVCSVRTKAGPKLACVDGPVFDLKSLVGKS